MITSNKLILTTKDVIPTNTYKNLISGKTSAVIIQNFLTKHRCKKIIRDIAIYEASSGCGLKEKIGESINSYVSNKSEYFTKTKISNYYLRKIFSYNDPRKIMFEKISKLLHGKIKFARENSMPYSEGIIRFISQELRDNFIIFLSPFITFFIIYSIFFFKLNLKNFR